MDNKQVDDIFAAAGFPQRHPMSDDDYQRMQVRNALERDPAFAKSQAIHFQGIAAIWVERAMQARDGGFPHAAIAHQAAAARVARLSRAYAGIEEY